MSCSTCTPLTPIERLMQATSPQALLQPKPKPADPFDPKQLLTPQNPLDPATSSNASKPTRGPTAAGTGLLVDTSA